MFETEKLKLRFVIEDEEITFDSFNEYVWLINDFLKDINEDLLNKIKTKEEKEWQNGNQPHIVSVSNGCIIIDVIIPIICALIPIFYDIIKTKIQSYKSNSINFNQNDNSVHFFKLYGKYRQNWDLNDEKLFVKKIVNTYVRRKTNKDVDVFVRHLPSTLKKYGRKSLICKVKNSKAIFEVLNASNSLITGKLSHYSKRHMELTLIELNMQNPSKVQLP